jgi:hypothetical protein
VFRGATRLCEDPVSSDVARPPIRPVPARPQDRNVHLALAVAAKLRRVDLGDAARFGDVGELIIMFEGIGAAMPEPGRANFGSFGAAAMRLRPTVSLGQTPPGSPGRRII